MAKASEECSTRRKRPGGEFLIAWEKKNLNLIKFVLHSLKSNSIKNSKYNERIKYYYYLVCPCCFLCLPLWWWDPWFLLSKDRTAALLFIARRFISLLGATKCKYSDSKFVATIINCEIYNLVVYVHKYSKSITWSFWWLNHRYSSWRFCCCNWNPWTSCTD